MISRRLLFVISFYKLLSKRTGKLIHTKKSYVTSLIKVKMESKIKHVLMNLRIFNASRGRKTLFEQLRKINLKVQEFLFHDVTFRGKVALMQEKISKKLDDE